MRGARTRQGLSLIEMLIALAIISIAFGALALVQVSNLRASSRSRLTTDAKAVANQVLEKEMSQVLKVDEVTAPGDANCNSTTADEVDTDPSTGTTSYKCFWFSDYYWQCPALSGGAYFTSYYQGTRTALRSVSCGHQTFTTSSENPDVKVAIAIVAANGTDGEGLLNVSVTARHDLGPEITLGDSVTCYDVYPSPAVNTPAPCPEPDHGRP